MARIRTIKPEFWTDGTMVQLPFEARLLFIGLWNFADDDGLLWDEPERIRLQIFPGDPVDVALLLDLLVAAERLERFETDDGRRFLFIRHFSDHQKVDHPSRSVFPPQESRRKLSIPSASRRAVALKYACQPGEEKEVDCYYCGEPGRIHWFRHYGGRPHAWVAFSNLELDHFVSEASGGSGEPDNLVLACRACNRSKRERDGIQFLARSLPQPEPSQASPNVRDHSRDRASYRSLKEGKGGEGNGDEGKPGPSPARAEEPPAADAAPPRQAIPKIHPPGPGFEPLRAAFRELGLPDPPLDQGVEITAARSLLKRGPPGRIAQCWQEIASGDYGGHLDRIKVSFRWLNTDNLFVNWLNWKEGGSPTHAATRNGAPAATRPGVRHG